jgi:hypothetical protein
MSLLCELGQSGSMFELSQGRLVSLPITCCHDECSRGGSDARSKDCP